MTSACRYAVYWVPDRDHPLWSAGCAWLGRDAENDERRFALREHTDEPRRYGFHATLKPPMRLKDGVDQRAFLAAVRTVAADIPRFAMPALAVGRLGRFIALCPVVDLDPDHALQALADCCVVALDGFRAASLDADMARRATGLDVRQQALQDRWGYPFVLDLWRFHMTLSNALADDPSRDEMAAAARSHFASALAEPLVATAIAVFVEAQPHGPFRLAHRFALRD